LVINIINLVNKIKITLALPHDILIVDDHDDIVNLMKIVLQMNGFSAHEFTDPILALDYFKTDPKKFALAITDFRMPGMNGIDLLVKIKKVCPNIKTFVVTAVDMDNIKPEIKKHALEIEELFQKPLSLQNLIKSVINIFVK
jgi:DNA-binding NtrC family response regulator